MPKGASLRILRISPVALRLPKNGDDAKFLEKVLEKNFGGNRDALEPEEEARVRKIIQKSIDAKKISPENLGYFKKLVELMDKRADLVTREKVTSQTKSFVEDRNAQEKGKAAVASPEDEKKQKEANGALMVGGEARQEAARLKEMLSELTDEERESVNQIVREHLKYSSIEEILADDHKINEAWGLFVNIENKCAALPGKDLTKSLLQTAFVSMTKRKVAVDGDE